MIKTQLRERHTSISFVTIIKLSGVIGVIVLISGVGECIKLVKHVMSLTYNI